MKTILTMLLVLTVAASPALAQAAAPADVWRTFASALDVGGTVRVRLQDGRRFRATLIAARPDALLLQPRTRVPVPVQPVSYDTIVSLERDRSGGGVGAGKAALIGIASGVGAFLATLAIIIAAVED